MKCKIDIPLLKTSIYDSCGLLFTDYQMRKRAYEIVSSNIEDTILEYADDDEEE